MKRAAYTLYIIIATFILAGCGGKSEFRQTLESLDSVLVSSPDSVYDVLNKLEPQKQSEADRMYFELLRADAQNKAYIDFTTDSVMKEVVKYFDHHGNSNEQMRAHYLLGCTYRDLQDVPMELQCFQEAVEKADTTKTDCDLYTLGAIYGQMANIYHNQFLPEEELKALDVCESIDKRTKDTIRAIKAYELHLRPYLLLDSTDCVLVITRNAREKYLELNNKQQAARLLSPAINILLSRNQIDSAQKYMDIFEKESGLFMNENVSSDNAKMYYHNKGKLFSSLNQLDSAKYYFSELLKSGWKEAAYEGYVNLYRKTNEPDSLAKYASLYVAANDSARASTSTEVIAQMAEMYNYAHQAKRNKELMISIGEEKLANQTMLLYVVIVSFAIIILTLLFVYAYKEHYRKNKQQLADTITRFNSIKQLLEESEIQKKELESKLASSKDMSEEAINSYKDEISTLNKRIEESNQQIACYRETFTDVDFNAWLDRFLTAEIVFKYKDLLRPGKPGKVYSANDNMWKLAYEHFNKNASEFVKYLESEKYGLNELDIKVVILTVFDFGTSETATIMEKSNNHITNIRKRITNKLFPQSSHPRNLRNELLTAMKIIHEVSAEV